MPYKYKYKSFGFKINSELKIPLLSETNDEEAPDLIVHRGDLSDPKEGLQNSREEYFGCGKDISYLIRNGNEITVDLPGELSSGFLCPGFINIVAWQQGIYALHGVAVFNGEYAVLICGDHGAGKSTLAYEMLLRGWHFLTDDVALIEKDNGTFYIRSGNPVQKLRREMVENNNIGVSSRYPVISECNSDRYYVDVSGSYEQGRFPLSLIVYIEPNGKEFSTVEVTGAQKLPVLRNAILNAKHFTDEDWNKTLQFSVNLAAAVPVLQMNRGELSEEYNAICGFLNRFTVELGGKVIQLHPFSLSLKRVFLDYLSSKPFDISIKLTEAMVEIESGIRRDYATTRDSNYVLSEALSEESAACRAISERLPEFGTFLLHGSAISYKENGIVFVASSGTGKSTYSRSWVNCFPDDVRYINDDKPFVRVEGGCAKLYGSPWNGKHRLGSNCSCQLKAICLLERSESNWAKKESASKVLPELLSHLYIPETPLGRNALFSLIQQLSGIVSFYRVGCNLDKDASVACKEELFEK